MGKDGLKESLLSYKQSKQPARTKKLGNTQMRKYFRCKLRGSRTGVKDGKNPLLKSTDEAENHLKHLTMFKETENEKSCADKKCSKPN